MQPEQIEKIKNLIQAATILTPSEKQEWRQLLPLMNDKQLVEFKGILESFLPDPAPALPPKNAILPQTKPAEPKAEIPALHHILNMPKSSGDMHFNDQEPARLKTPSAVSASTAAASPTKPQDKKPFWQKIKQTLTEKELPAGHPSSLTELELTGPGAGNIKPSQTVVPQKKAEAPFKPIPSVPKNSPAAPLPPISKPKAPSLPPPPVPSVKPKEGDLAQQIIDKAALNNNSGSALTAAKLPATKPIDNKTSFAKAPAFAKASSALKAMGDKSEDKLFVPGLKQTKILMDAKFGEGNLEPEGKFSPAVPKGPAAPRLPVSGNTVSFKSLEDLSGFTINALDQNSANNLAEQIKNLIKLFGFHKVIFMLEKSPIFLSYLNTGMAVLAGKYDLNSGQYLEETNERFLNKEEFEKFVDVLRAIKGS